MFEKNLVIVGAGEFAEIAYEYFTYDSEYKVVGFAVEKEYITQNELYGLPIVPLEEIEELYSKDSYYVFVAVTYTKLNRVRTRLYNLLKQKGYKFASYISSKAFVWRNVQIGENCFIFENNVIQHHVIIGNNVILWSGNHIGHRSEIQDNCFISSHVVISGYCNIGSSCFIGVNTTFADHISIKNDCFIGAGCLINKNLEAESICKSNNSSDISKISSLRFFKIRDEHGDK